MNMQIDPSGSSNDDITIAHLTSDEDLGAFLEKLDPKQIEMLESHWEHRIEQAQGATLSSEVLHYSTSADQKTVEVWTMVTYRFKTDKGIVELDRNITYRKNLEGQKVDEWIKANGQNISHKIHLEARAL